MDKELKETVLQVAEYTNAEKEKSARIVNVYFIAGITALVVNLSVSFMDIDGTFLKGFIEGLTQTLAMLAMVMGLLYTTGRLSKLFAFKKRLLGRKEADQ